MERSWVSFFLPKDEYKKMRILYFIAESFFLLVIFLLFIIFSNRFLNFFGDGTGFLLLILLIIIIGYVLIRYIFSGIEYVDIFDKNDYDKEFKKMFRSGFKFGLIFFVFSSFLKLLDIVKFNWSDIFGLTFLVFILIIIMNYVSLRFSYKKNNE